MNKNEFVYKAARKDCIGRSDEWVKVAVNTVLQALTDQINRDNKAPASEQLDRIETVLQALKDEIKERGVE